MHLLDGFGGHDREVADYRAAHRALREAAARLRALSTDAGEAERRKAYLQFQVDEIAKAALLPGEDESLEQERRRLANAERIGAACASACDLLYEGDTTENPAGALISAAAKALEEVAGLDPSQEELAARAGELRFAAEDLAARVREYMAQVQADPRRLAAVEERLHLIRSLKRKYGLGIPEIIAAGEALAAELSSLENRDAELAAARAEVERAAALALVAAGALTARRLRAAGEFQRQVAREMRGLELPRAAFSALVSPRQPHGGGDAEGGAPDPLDVPEIQGVAALGPDGADTVEFLVALNPGEEARPLRKVASGGEIARIMLAIKSVLAGRDEIPTLIFDEIDVGVSGEAAARVGEKLARLSESHQVLCITHLPQVAARGDHHLSAGKRVVQGRTRAEVRRLEGAERAAAVAQMLSGREVDEESLRYARKLLSRPK
jgi:DNA repair protein RecN (Recombination protein N)